jgi:hypothetical protein
MDFIHSTRPSPISGTWYTRDAGRLRAEIDQYIEGAVLSHDEFKGDVFGIVAPHAGHIYSGKTAGYAYRMVKGLKRDIVVVLSPFHQYHPADVLTTAYDSYATPLGSVPIEMQLLCDLDVAMQEAGLPITQIDHDPEHAIEIQLPFLQCAIDGDFTLLPLMIRTHTTRSVRLIAQKLTEMLAGRTYLIVASTDLSHFFPLETAQELDAEMLRRIKAMDADGVLSAEMDGSASACGAPAVAVLLYAAKMQRNADVFILNYSTSADVTGDTSSVVGYGSAAVMV